MGRLNFKGELQALVLEQNGSSFWKTLYTVKDVNRDHVLKDLYAKVDEIKSNRDKYVQQGQELLNGSMLINDELITVLLFDLTEEQEKELQEAFDDVMKFEAELRN